VDLTTRGHKIQVATRVWIDRAIIPKEMCKKQDKTYNCWRHECVAKKEIEPCLMGLGQSQMITTKKNKRLLS